MTVSSCASESHICFNCFLGLESSNILKIVELIHQLGWGNIDLTIKAGKVTMIKSTQNIKLDGEVKGT